MFLDVQRVSDSYQDVLRANELGAAAKVEETQGGV